MKYLKKYFLVLAAAILLAASCASGSEGEQAAAPTPDDGAAAATDPTATPAAKETEVAVDEPTPTEPIELTEEDMIAAALAAFEANPEPETLVAWDHLHARLSGNEVTLTMCTWTGDAVFDDVRAANYIVTPDTNGDPKTRFNFSNGLFGQECLNTELIESALAFTREYDTYWGGVLADPTTFDPEEAAEFGTAEVVEVNTQAVEEWVRDDLHFEGTARDAELPDSAVAEILGRRFLVQGEEYFELLACRTMDERYGLYQGEVLVDDGKGERVENNSIVKYRLARRDEAWLLAGAETNLWGDCINTRPNWLDGVNEWQPDPVSWRIVVQL